MPELPEAETIVRYLKPKIRGKRILGVEVLGKRVLRRHRNSAEFKKALVGKKILGLRRIGKNIIFELQDGTTFVAHLMMTGQLLWNPRKKLGHERLRFFLSEGNILAFNDIRQFGWCRVISGSPTSRGKSDFEELNTGPDALSLNFGTFKSLFRSRSAVIKNLLLNQKIVSGIGNIYADEILWHAGIHPLHRADDLSDNELRKLHRAIQGVLKLAIRKGGTSSRDYRKPDGKEGGYYPLRKAYQRSGEPCSRDGAEIKRIVVGQRPTYFCPDHQK